MGPARPRALRGQRRSDPVLVLSGFPLYRGYARAALGSAEPPRLASYARRRAARIVPAYYVCIVGCIVSVPGLRPD